MAYMLRYDSTHGRYNGTVEVKINELKNELENYDLEKVKQKYKEYIVKYSGRS